MAAVLDAAVDAPARPDGAAVPDAAAYGVYPLIILIVYVLVTGGILCSDLRRSSPTTGTSPLTTVGWQKTRRIDLSCGIKISPVGSLD